MLTSDDLQKIAVLINDSVNQAKKELLFRLDEKADKDTILKELELIRGTMNSMATKDQVDDMIREKIDPIKNDINQLKDDYAAIRKELDTEHDLRYQKLEQVVVDVECIKKHLRLKD